MSRYGDRVLVVGFAGRARAGKDAAIDRMTPLLAQRDICVVRVAWADELKRIAARLYRLTPDQIDGDLKEVTDDRWGLSPRMIMQRFGTEVGRAVHPLTWVRFLIETEIPDRLAHPIVRDHIERDGRVVVAVSGTRFEEEVTAIHAERGKVVRVSRPGVRAVAAHSSETGIDHLVVDADIENVSTPEFLGNEAANLIKQWMP